tara:strand:+ start:505 stop:705 length:201 start_codon:yes stop_codon:yes gene_type:complete
MLMSNPRPAFSYPLPDATLRVEGALLPTASRQHWTTRTLFMAAVSPLVSSLTYGAIQIQQPPYMQE